MARGFGEELLQAGEEGGRTAPRLAAYEALGHTLFCLGDYARPDMS